jgi:hypothetical protein
MLLNIESSKPNITVTLVTDIILLLIMLAGLLRIRLHGGGTCGLWRLLWKHVGYGGFPVVVVPSIR